MALELQKLGPKMDLVSSRDAEYSKYNFIWAWNLLVHGEKKKNGIQTL